MYKTNALRALEISSHKSTLVVLETLRSQYDGHFRKVMKTVDRIEKPSERESVEHFAQGMKSIVDDLTVRTQDLETLIKELENG